MPEPPLDRSTDAPRAVKWSFFICAAGLVVYLCVLMLRPVFNVIAWSAVLAITCYPVHQRVMRTTGRVGLSASITSILVVLAVLVPLVFIAGTAVGQLLALGDWLQDAFRSQNGAGAAAPVLAWLTRHFPFDAEAIGVWLREHASELARGAGEYTLSIAASVGGAIASFIFIIFAMFLFLRDGERMIAKIPALLPFEPTRSQALLLRVRDAVNGAVYGVVVIALIQGALCGGMFWLLGIPSAALWAMVTVLTSVLPLLGATAVWAPGTLYLILIGEWQKAIVMGIWGAAVVSSVDNFLRPRLVAGQIGLSELAMFFALLGGLQVFGVLGIVLGPVVFAIAVAVIEVLSEPKPVGTAPARMPHDEVV
jgi:predicted PurR-regulated permease PerM